MGTPYKDVLFPTVPSGPPVPPTVTSFTLGSQSNVTLSPATDTQILPANSSRTLLNIVNLTGGILYLTFSGGAASTSTFPIGAGAAFDACVSVNYQMLRGEIRGYSVLGGLVGRLDAT